MKSSKYINSNGTIIHKKKRKTNQEKELSTSSKLKAKEMDLSLVSFPLGDSLSVQVKITLLSSYTQSYNYLFLSFYFSINISKIFNSFECFAFLLFSFWPYSILFSFNNSLYISKASSFFNNSFLYHPSFIPHSERIFLMEVALVWLRCSVRLLPSYLPTFLFYSLSQLSILLLFIIPMQNKYHSLIHSNSHFHLLIVGAGGIGCELIKNVYKWGYEVTLMDYDTISQTNLNRQFCYRHSDINKSKASTLQQYFKKLNPHFKLNIIVGKLQDYGIQFFSHFDIIVSALDNNEGRKYLNQMAFKNGKSLVDAGTAAYNGQVQSYIRGLTQCRFCKNEGEEQNNIGMCTVRNKPERNIHCVHFGLNFYNNWSCKSEGELSLSKYAKNEWSLEEIREDCIRVHDYLFGEGIPEEIGSVNRVKYKKMEMRVENLLERMLEDGQFCEFIWPIENYSQIFVQCLTDSLLNQELFYQKDNNHHILLLTSIVNLRIHNFKSISTRLHHMTFYQCKDSCGRIQPAIASTNASAAALQIFHLIEILNKKEENVKYLSIHGFSNKKIEGINSRKPTIDCMLCSKSNFYVEVSCNFEKYSLKEVEQHLSKRIDESLLSRDIRCGQHVIVRKSSPGSNYNRKIIELKSLIKCEKRKEVRIKYLKRKKNKEFANYEIALLDHEKDELLIKDYDKERVEKQIKEYERQYEQQIQRQKQWQKIQNSMKNTAQTKAIEILQDSQIVDI